MEFISIVLPINFAPAPEPPDGLIDIMPISESSINAPLPNEYKLPVRNDMLAVKLFAVILPATVPPVNGNALLAIPKAALA